MVDISADGRTLLGQSVSGVPQDKFIWSLTGGYVSLGMVESAYFSRGLTSDASIAVGQTPAGLARWTADQGTTSLDVPNARPQDVSADGSVIVGGGGLIDPWVWSTNAGLEPITNVHNSGLLLVAVSGDGQCAVGEGEL